MGHLAHAESTVRFRIESEPATLDWNKAHSWQSSFILLNIMSGLTQLDEQLKVQPALAEKWEVSDDHKTYTFHLRKNILWSNGTPLKAEHFLNSWKRLLDPKTNSNYAFFFSDVQSFSSPKPGQIVIKLKRAVPYFPQLTTYWVTFPILNAAFPSDPSKLTTLGPYKISSYSKGKNFVLVKNPNFYAAQSLNDAPDQIEVRIEPSADKGREWFKSGEVDFLLNASTTDLLAFEKTEAQKNPYLATYYLGFNTKKAPLNNSDFRKSLALAVDRNKIPGILQSGQIPAKGWIPPGLIAHDNGALLQGGLYDARASLSKAGFPEGHGLRKLSLWVEKFDGHDKLADLITRDLKQNLGIQVEVKIGDNRTYHEALRKKQMDLFIARWGADFPDPANFFSIFGSKSGTNYTGWTNASFDELLEKAMTTSSVSDRTAVYKKAEELLLQKEVVILPLFYRYNLILLGPRIKKVALTPLNYLFFSEIRLK